MRTFNGVNDGSAFVLLFACLALNHGDDQVLLHSVPHELRDDLRREGTKDDEKEDGGSEVEETSAARERDY